MITPQDKSYWANEDCTSPVSLGTRSPAQTLRSPESLSFQIGCTLKVLFGPRQVVELRAFKGRETAVVTSTTEKPWPVRPVSSTGRAAQFVSL
jgi:hypothetical protein